MKKFSLMSLLFALILLQNSIVIADWKQGSERLDSLINSLESYNNDDSSKVMLLSSISFEYYKTNPEKGLFYGKEGLKLANKINSKHGIAYCYRSLGVNYTVMSDYAKALEYFYEALKLCEELNDTAGISKIYSPIGNVYRNQKNYKKALEYYRKALKINEESGNTKEKAVNYGNIANVLNIEGKYEEAKEYYLKALKIAQDFNDLSYQATIYGNLGRLYIFSSDLDKALVYHNKSLELNLKLKNKSGTMMNYGTIGIIIFNITDDSTDKKLTKSKKMILLKNSKDYILKAIEIAKEINYNDELIQWYSFLGKIYEKLQQWEKAYYYSNLSNELKEKVYSDQSRNKILSLEFKQERELKDKEIKIQKLELERKNLFITFTIGALILSSLLAFFIYTRFRIKKKSNEILENKNKLISEQNYEIKLQKEKIDIAFSNIKLLSEIGQDITSNLSPESITEVVYKNIKTLMNSTVFGIGLFNSELQRLEFYGGKEMDETLPFFCYELGDDDRLAVHCFKFQKAIIISDYLNECTNYLSHIPIPKAGKNTESLLYLPLNTKCKRIGVITVQSFEKNVYTEYHLDILKNLSLYVAIALDNAYAYQHIEKQNAEIEEKIKILQGQSIEISEINNQLVELNESKDKYLNTLKSELEIAVNYVRSLIPKPIEKGPIVTDWIYIPSFQLGGDSLGYHWVDQDNFAFYLFDVSGHGIGAALHSVSILNSLKNQTLLGADFLNPKDVLTKLNQIYQMKKHNNFFFTIWYGVFNLNTKVLNFASAGHPYALYLPNDDTSVSLGSKNPLIGSFKDYNFDDSSIIIKGISSIFIYSDGVYEVVKGDNSLWEQRELDQWLKTNQNQTDIGNKLFEFVASIKGSSHLDDDFSLLRIKFEFDK